MKIDCALRCRPFSHLPGSECILPGSHLLCRAYPARLEIWDIKCAAAIGFTYQGLMREFTVTADLESYEVSVSGFTDGGYFRYRLKALASGFSLEMLKAPTGLVVDIQDTAYAVEEKADMYIFSNGSKDALSIPHREKLSLGCSKAQDVEMMFRRQDIREIVPFVYYYGQSVAADVHKHLIADDAMQAQKQLYEMALIGFKSLFVPRVEDDQHVGMLPPLHLSGMSPAFVLRQLFTFVRQLFFQELKGCYQILPLLPPQFHCGRLTQLVTLSGHRISLEWTKKCMRRLILWPAADEEISLQFPSGIKNFRSQSKGRSEVKANGSCFLLQNNTPLLLDNFQA